MIYLFPYIEDNQLAPQYSDHLLKNDFTLTDLSNNNLLFHIDFYRNNLINSMEIEKNFLVDSENEQKKNLKFDIKKLTKKKRGRRSKRNECERIHDKRAGDNIMRKIQSHYLSFIISFLNNILEILNYKQQFFKLDYEFKRNVKKNFVESLKRKTLAEIVCNKISIKYKHKDVNSNFIIYNEIKENKILNNILSENYVKFFKKIYYKSNKHINLEEDGLNKNITLSNNVKMFKDLLKKDGILNSNNEFKQNINECLIKNFMPNSKFLFH